MATKIGQYVQIGTVVDVVVVAAVQPLPRDGEKKMQFAYGYGERVSIYFFLLMDFVEAIHSSAHFNANPVNYCLHNLSRRTQRNLKYKISRWHNGAMCRVCCMLEKLPD